MNARLLIPLVAPALILAAFVGGCSSDSGSGGSCMPGEAHACSCAGGAAGMQTCGTGGQYGACSCTGGADGGGGADAGPSSDADSCADGRTGPGCNHGDGSTPGYDGSWESGGPGTFGAPCTQSSDCQSMDCFDFNSKGMRCTQPCTTAADCPNPPNLGCSGMGQCKVP